MSVTYCSTCDKLIDFDENIEHDEIDAEEKISPPGFKPVMQQFNDLMKQGEEIVKKYKIV